LSNKFGGISCPTIQFRPSGQKSQCHSQPQPIIAAVVKDHFAKDNNSKILPNKNVKSDSNANIKLKSANKLSFSSNPVTENPKIDTTATPTITKQKQSNTVIESSVSAEQPEPKVAATNKKSEKKSRTIKDDEEEEWDDGSNYKVDAERLKRRIGFEETQQQSSSNSSSVPPAVSSSSCQQDSVDDNNNSHLVSNDNCNNVVNSLNTVGGDVEIISLPPPAKRTRRKLVEKIFADEKGYLVTEMVWEDVLTDDESATNNKHSAAIAATRVKSSATSTSEGASSNSNPPPSTATAPAAATTKKPASKKAAALVTGQKSMTSFFSKK